MGLNVVKDIDFKTLGSLEANIPKTLVYIENENYLDIALKNKNINGVIINENLKKRVPDEFGIIVSEKPIYTFNKIHEFLIQRFTKKVKSKVSGKAIIHESAKIASYNVVINDNVIIEENVVIKSGVHIDKHSIVRANTVIGSEGFEIKKIENKNQIIKHNGLVLIGKNVEIQSNCCIDKG